MSAQESNQVWGATSTEWAHFDFILGLTNDLLPVVSNPQARISPDSKMKEKGKTPSQYNGNRMVAGFPGWTSYHAGATDLAKWSANPDYGICVQTRYVRAIDVDVTDAHVAERLREFIIAQLGYCPPVRRRSNSSKFLMTVAIPGEFGKRKVLVPGGAVEILATGQQFIAVGTHPSGVPYSWEGGLPDDIPEISMAQFEELWGAMVAEFAIEPPTESRASKAVVRQPGELYDPVAEYLEEQGWMHDAAADGRIFIRCPFEDEHTSASGGSDTTYFTRGTGGYDQGHFKCLHAHCTGREDHEFLEGIGFLQAQIPDVPVVVGEAETLPRPAYERERNGQIVATIGNVLKALRRPDECGMLIGYDGFRDEVMLSRDGGENWDSFTDHHYVELREHLEEYRDFKPIGRELVRDAVGKVAVENAFDSAIQWLETLQWDGVPRVASFAAKYLGAADTPYATAVSLYMWTAMAGRVLQPGCKADMAPILIGAQGLYKSTAAKLVVPHDRFYAEVSFHEKEPDLARKMRGRLVAEIAELKGLNSRDLESIKAFISRTHEDWTPKFKEFNTTFPRRLIFIGTTNQKEFLADETGNRRWLPIRVGRADIAAIERDRLQLWAEAAALFLVDGVAWRDAEKLAQEVHAEYMIQDPWRGLVERYLETPDMDGSTPLAKGYVQTLEVLQFAIQVSTQNITRREELRVAGILRMLGLENGPVREGARVFKGWRNPS